MIDFLYTIFMSLLLVVGIWMSLGVVSFFGYTTYLVVSGYLKCQKDDKKRKENEEKQTE